MHILSQMSIRISVDVQNEHQMIRLEKWMMEECDDLVDRCHHLEEVIQHLTDLVLTKCPVDNFANGVKEHIL